MFSSEFPRGNWELVFCVLGLLLICIHFSRGARDGDCFDILDEEDA